MTMGASLDPANELMPSSNLFKNRFLGGFNLIMDEYFNNLLQRRSARPSQRLLPTAGRRSCRGGFRRPWRRVVARGRLLPMPEAASDCLLPLRTPNVPTPMTLGSWRRAPNGVLGPHPRGLLLLPRRSPATASAECVLLSLSPVVLPPEALCDPRVVGFSISGLFAPGGRRWRWAATEAVAMMMIQCMECILHPLHHVRTREWAYSWKMSDFSDYVGLLGQTL